MNPLIPIFVIVPLAGAFLIMILGKFFRDINKYITSLILLFLLVLSILALINTGENMSLYKVGGWEPVNSVPNWYLYGNGWLYNNCLMHNKYDWFPVSNLFNLIYQPIYIRELFLCSFLPYDSRYEWSCSQRRSL